MSSSRDLRLAARSAAFAASEPAQRANLRAPGQLRAMRASSPRHRARRSPSATPRRSGGAASRGRRTRGKPCSRQRGISDGLDASAACDIISAELREASFVRGGRAAGEPGREPDPHADLDFEAHAELLAATEQSLLAELREDVASLDGPGGEEYEAFLDWAAQGDEAIARGGRRGGRRRLGALPGLRARRAAPTADGWVVTAAPPATALRLWPRATPRPSSSFASGWRRSSRSTASPVAGARCRLPTEFEATGRLLMSCETCGSNVVVV